MARDAVCRKVVMDEGNAVSGLTNSLCVVSQEGGEKGNVIFTKSHRSKFPKTPWAVLTEVLKYVTFF